MPSSNRSRWLRPFFTSTIALFFAFGCSKSNPSTEIVVIGEDSANLQAMESLKGGFEKQTGITVKFVRDPFDVALRKSNQDLANKTGQFDIICQYAASLAPYVNNDYVLTLDDLARLVPPSEVPRTFENDYFPGVWRETGFYKKPGSSSVIRVAYPFAATTMLLVYNKEMFDDKTTQSAYQAKYGNPLEVPKTWEEYVRIAEFFTNPTQDTYGVVMEGATDGFLYWEWCNFAYSMGGGVMKKDAGWEGDASTPILLDSPENLHATEVFVSLKKCNAGDFFSVGSAEQRDIFLSKKVAMGIMWSDYIPNMLASPRAAKIGFAPIPGGKSMLGGATFFLNKSSKHPREAALYVLSLMQPEQQIQLAMKGLGSPFKSVYEDKRVQAIPYSAALKESLERGVYMIESGPDSEIVQNVITDKVQAMWKGTVSVREGLTSAKTEIEAKRKALYAK